MNVLVIYDTNGHESHQIFTIKEGGSLSEFVIGMSEFSGQTETKVIGMYTLSSVNLIK